MGKPLYPRVGASASAFRSGLAPNDPAARPNIIRKALRTIDPRGTDFVAINADGEPEYHGIRYSCLRAEPVVELNTMRVTTHGGHFAPDTTVAIVALHGMVGGMSQMGSLYSFLEALVRYNDIDEGELADDSYFFLRNIYERFKRKGTRLKFAAEVIDLPGHGTGPRADAFGTIDQSLHFLRVAILDLRRRLDAAGLQHVPINVLGRSSAMTIFWELARREPELFDATSAVGPTHPDLEVGFLSSYAAVLDEALTSTGFLSIKNFRALRWLKSLQSQLSWHRDPRPFGDIPTYISVGGNDRETSEESREWFADAVKKTPFSEYHSPFNRAHDTLKVEAPRIRSTRSRGMTHEESFDLITTTSAIYESYFQFLDGVSRRRAARFGSR